MNEEQQNALKRILDYANPSELRVMTMGYTSPAQRLRNQADEMEQRERDYGTLWNYLNQLPKADKPINKE